MGDAYIRLNKYLSEAGYCSRRQADRLIEEGRVTIDGQIAGVGSKVTPGQSVAVEGEIVKHEQRPILLAVNKPKGVVCTSERKWGDKLIEDLIDLPERLYPIGRLDKESEGLILMTNQGDLLNKILKSENSHEKEYIVRVDKPVREVDLHVMAAGMYLEELNRTTKPCRIRRIDDCTFRMILTQGLNRQIRRMCRARGYHVRFLRRVRIMNIELGSLASGEYRNVTPEEMRELTRLLKHSSNNTEQKYRNSPVGQRTDKETT